MDSRYNTIVKVYIAGGEGARLNRPKFDLKIAKSIHRCMNLCAYQIGKGCVMYSQKKVRRLQEYQDKYRGADAGSIQQHQFNNEIKRRNIAEPARHLESNRHIADDLG